MVPPMRRSPTDFPLLARRPVLGPLVALKLLQANNMVSYAVR